MTRKIRVGVASPGPLDATSYYRCWGPWSRITKIFSNDIEIVDLSHMHWKAAMSLDLLFFQRPDNSDHLAFIQKAKAYGLPVWIDYDDHMGDVPESNEIGTRFRTPEVQANITKCLELADLTTTTTPFLATYYSQLCKQVRVIPNAWDNVLFPIVNRPPREVKRDYNVICWRGTIYSHMDDFKVIEETFLKLAKAKYNHFLFLGGVPPFASQLDPKKTTIIQFIEDIGGFFQTFRAERPDVLVVPLVDRPFNRAKSAIAAYEAAYANVPVIAPNWDTWQYSHVTNYNDPNEIHDLVKEVLHLNNTQERDYTAVQVPTLAEANQIRALYAFQLTGKPVNA